MDILLVAPNGDVEKLMKYDGHGLADHSEGTTGDRWRTLTILDSYDLFDEYRDLSDYKLVFNFHSIDTRRFENLGYDLADTLGYDDPEFADSYLDMAPSFISWALRCGYGLFIDAPLPR